MQKLRLSLLWAATALFLHGCAYLPAILGGQAAKDAIIAAEDGVEAVIDPEHRKEHEHDAIEKAADAAVEAAEAVAGVNAPVDIQIWDDEASKKK